MARILLVCAPYYKDITQALIAGAKAELEGHEVRHIDVPGAFEIPTAIAMIHRTAPYDGYVALGCVIRGETTHYDYVCSECARGLQWLAMDQRMAIGFGVLTVENEEQAWARADVNGKNKGREAASACLGMLALKDLCSRGQI